MGPATSAPRHAGLCCWPGHCSGQGRVVSTAHGMPWRGRRRIAAGAAASLVCRAGQHHSNAVQACLGRRVARAQPRPGPPHIRQLCKSPLWLLQGQDCASTAFQSSASPPFIRENADTLPHLQHWKRTVVFETDDTLQMLKVRVLPVNTHSLGMVPLKSLFSSLLQVEGGGAGEARPSCLAAAEMPCTAAACCQQPTAPRRLGAASHSQVRFCRAPSAP